MRRHIAAAAAILTFLSFQSALAQAVSQPQTSAKPVAPVTDIVAVPLWPTAAISLPETQPAPASFALGKIEGVAPELLSGVTAKGYARKVSVEGQSIGQVMVVSVAKGDREETISAEGLTAQFDAKENAGKLFPEKTMQVEGSKAALVAALQRLAAPKPAEQRKDPPKDDVSQNPVAGNKSSNDIAAGYQSPTVAATPATTEKEPVTDTRTTKEGCTTRIDTAQEVAVQQSKIQTFTDGALTTDGDCTDSDVKFPLKRSYASCPVDVVDLPSLTAWPQYSVYYTDDASDNHTVSDCTKDTDSAYAITEDESQCSISIEIGNARAVPQAALIYTNRNNATVQARGCSDSTKSAAIPMSESVANCSIRHDYAGGRSYELSMWTYGGLVIAPAFGADEKAQGLTDFNDLAKSRGPRQVALAIDGALSRQREPERSIA